MDPIKDIIPEVIQALSERSPQQDLKLQRVWENCVDDDLRQYTEIAGLEQGILTIKTDHQMRAYKLKMQARLLLKKINEEIPDIKKIVIRTG